MFSSPEPVTFSNYQLVFFGNKCKFFTVSYNRREVRFWNSTLDSVWRYSFTPALFHLSQHLKTPPNLPQPPQISVRSVRRWASDLPPPVSYLQTSSGQISALLSPAQLLKVGPRRNCRKATHAICSIWNLTHGWPWSQVQKKTDLHMTRFTPS